MIRTGKKSWEGRQRIRKRWLRRKRKVREGKKGSGRDRKNLRSREKVRDGQGGKERGLVRKTKN